MRKIFSLALAILSSACGWQSNFALGEPPVSSCRSHHVVDFAFQDGLPVTNLIVANSSAPIEMVLDTGASIPLIRDAVSVDPQSIEVSENVIVAQTFDGPVNLRTTLPLKFTHDGCDLGSSIAALVPVDSPPLIDASENWTIKRSLLGLSVLGKYHVEFDFPNNELILKYSTAETSISDDLSITPHAIKLATSNREYSCLVDTGLNSSVRGLFVQPGHAIISDIASNVLSVGNSRQSRNSFGAITQYVIRNVELGGLSVDQLLLQVQNNELVDSLDDPKCFVGIDLLRKAKLILPAETRQAYLSGSVPIPFYNRTGLKSFLGMGEMGLQIGVIESGSPSNLSGLLSGDIILAVDEKPIWDVSVPQLKAIMSQEAGEVVSLEISRNGETLLFDIILQDML